MIKDREEIFTCDCHSREHMVVAGIHTWNDDDADFYLQVTADLNCPWYRRIVPAVKYLFGLPSLSWHDVLLSPADVYRLSSVIDDYNVVQAALSDKKNKAMKQHD